MTLFSMMLGREVQILEYLVFGLPVGDAHVPQGGGGGGGEQEYERLKKTMQNARKSIQDRAWKAMLHQKNVYDERQNQHQCYQKGDCVWLYCPAVSSSINHVRLLCQILIGHCLMVSLQAKFREWP